MYFTTHRVLAQAAGNDTVLLHPQKCCPELWRQPGQLAARATVSATKCMFIYNTVIVQARLELVQMTEPINRAEAFGRIAFSCPKAEVCEN